MIPKLSGEPLDLIAYEFGKDAEQTLQNCLRTFFKYLFPKIKAVETVEDCYNYHLWSQKIVLNGIKGGMSLLFESYQTGHYRDTEHYLEILLQDAYSLWKQAQQRPLNTSFGKENLEKAEKYYAKVLQRYNEVKGEDYLHLQLALESRIAQSKQNCEHYFNPTNKKHKDS